jgi:spore germination protein YaaH
MQRNWFKCLLAIGLALSFHVVQGQPLAGWGYVGWWLPQSWRTAPLEQFDRLLFFELKVGLDGRIQERHGWPEDWSALREQALNSRTPLDLTLTLFNPDEFNALFSSIEATRRLLDQSIALVAPFPMTGLQIDFEIYTPASPQSVENFRTFLRQLTTRLHAMSPPRNISVFLPVGGDTPLYDAPTLGVVNHIVMQGYDAHWPGSKNAGPVAPLRGDDAWSWERVWAYGQTLGVPGNKLLISFPLFGYEWPVKGRKIRSPSAGKGLPTTFAPIAGIPSGEVQSSVRERVLQYGASQDAASGSAYYQFRRGDGQYMEGWFEDWWTLDQKIDFLGKNKLGGLAFFLIGYDDDQLVNFFFQKRGPRVSSMVE